MGCWGPKGGGSMEMMEGEDVERVKRKKQLHRPIYLPEPSKGCQWMVKGAIKQPLRVQTPPLGGCWYRLLFIDYEQPKLIYLPTVRIVFLDRSGKAHGYIQFFETGYDLYNSCGDFCWP